MAIAAFEVGAGCGPFLMVWYINLSMFGLGLLVCPRTVFRAFMRGRQTASIYHREEDRDTLAAMSVAEIRVLLRLESPPRVASLADRVRFGAWAIIAVTVLLAPFVVLAGTVWGAIHLLVGR